MYEYWRRCVLPLPSRAGFALLAASFFVLLIVSSVFSLLCIPLYGGASCLCLGGKQGGTVLLLSVAFIGLPFFPSSLQCALFLLYTFCRGEQLLQVRRLLDYGDYGYYRALARHDAEIIWLRSRSKPLGVRAVGCCLMSVLLSADARGLFCCPLLRVKTVPPLATSVSTWCHPPPTAFLPI